MKNICLASIPAPWFFGPYAKQLYMLADQFTKMKEKYTVYYLCLGFDMKQQVYTYNEVLENFDEDYNSNKSKNSFNIINKKETLEKIKFIGGIEKINGGYTVSSFNKVMSYFNIDCVITCMDLVSIINDEIFKIKSLTWFPNHFQPIRSFDLSKLQIFSDIISLCPTDTKLLKKNFPKKNVSYIPHIIDFKISAEEIDKYKLRIKYKIPLDAFVVLINAGNYELQNRKSFDTSIFAFEKFVNKRKNAFLYIHSFNSKSFNDKNNFISSTSTMFNLKDLINQTEIPVNRVKINEELLLDNEIIELMQFSDVLLQSSKSEGFGVPMLEAQLSGLPVITTKFGAMDDYTFYGISVEPLQKMYEPTACGIWVLPSIEGICNALLSVANYEIEDKKEYAKKTITDLMSVEAVSNSFIKIIDEPFDANEHNIINLSSPNFIPISHIIYDNKSNSFYIDQEKCSNLDSNKLIKEWILFTDNTVSVNFDLIQNIMLSIKPDEPTNLILFKTSFNNDKNIYPIAEDINASNPNIDFNKMYYCIKKNIFHSFINNVTIENKYMREFILRHAVNICKVTLAEPIVLKEISSNKDNTFVKSNNTVKEFNNDINENLVIELSNGMEQNIMKYSEFFQIRKSTFEKAYTMILNNINKSASTYNIVELGTSRSFISNRIDTNINSWDPNNPNEWAWSDGIFTKVFSENLKNKNFKLYTVDPNKESLNVCKHMIDNTIVNNKVFFIEKYSTEFLLDIDFKIDFLYMDHMESGEESCLKHLEDIKFIIENNLMNKNGIILIDDVICSNSGTNKSKYSIPYLLDNNYNIVLKEYQAILVKNNFVVKTDAKTDANENLVIEITNGMKQNTETYNTKYGKITLYKNEVFIGSEFKQGKYWDELTLLKLKSYINPNHNILEIGGHCGTSSIVYSSYLNNDRKIYVYEPQKNMYDLLVKNINQNNLQNKVIPNNLGIFCYNGYGKMNNIDIDGGGGIVSKRYNEENNIGCNFGGIGLGNDGEVIELTTIDTLRLEDIGFIHCDAQGSEPFIFSKAINTIKKYRPIILYENIELYSKNLYHIICDSYPAYKEESRFDIKKYCIEQLNYSSFIDNFNGGIDTLLIP